MPVEWLGTLEPRPTPLVQALTAMQPAAQNLAEWLANAPDREKKMLDAFSSFYASLSSDDRKRLLANIAPDKAKQLADLSGKYGGPFSIGEDGTLQYTPTLAGQAGEWETDEKLAAHLLMPYLSATPDEQNKMITQPEYQEIFKQAKKLYPAAVYTDPQTGLLKPVVSLDWAARVAGLEETKARTGGLTAETDKARFENARSLMATWLGLPESERKQWLKDNQDVLKKYSDLGILRMNADGLYEPVPDVLTVLDTKAKEVGIKLSEAQTASIQAQTDIAKRNQERVEVAGELETYYSLPDDKKDEWLRTHQDVIERIQQVFPDKIVNGKPVDDMNWIYKWKNADLDVVNKALQNSLVQEQIKLVVAQTGLTNAQVQEIFNDIAINWSRLKLDEKQIELQFQLETAKLAETIREFDADLKERIRMDDESIRQFNEKVTEFWAQLQQNDEQFAKQYDLQLEELQTRKDEILKNFTVNMAQIAESREYHQGLIAANNKQIDEQAAEFAKDLALRTVVAQAQMKTDLIRANAEMTNAKANELSAKISQQVAQAQIKLYFAQAAYYAAGAAGGGSASVDPKAGAQALKSYADAFQSWMDAVAPKDASGRRLITDPKTGQTRPATQADIAKHLDTFTMITGMNGMVTLNGKPETFGQAMLELMYNPDGKEKPSPEVDKNFNKWFSSGEGFRVMPVPAWGDQFKGSTDLFRSSLANPTKASTIFNQINDAYSKLLRMPKDKRPKAVGESTLRQLGVTDRDAITTVLNAQKLTGLPSLDMVLSDLVTSGSKEKGAGSGKTSYTINLGKSKK